MCARTVSRTFSTAFLCHQIVLASVSPDRVRDRVNLSSSDIPDAKVTEFILDAEAEVELETDLEIDYSNCTQAEAACITDLAALLLPNTSKWCVHIREYHRLNA